MFGRFAPVVAPLAGLRPSGRSARTALAPAVAAAWALAIVLMALATPADAQMVKPVINTGSFHQLPTGYGIQLNAGTTSNPSLNIPCSAGAAPSSPNDGDTWCTTAGLFIRVGSTTIGPLVAIPTPVSVANGGTSSTSLTSHCVIIGAGTSAPRTVCPVASTDVLTDNGSGNDPSFQALPAAPTSANPTATAKDTAVNGSATTYMRSDAAPAVQKASASQFGIVEVDGSTITASGGVISSTGGATGANPTATASDTAVNGAAATFMRSDAAPAVQKGSSSQFGVVKVDGTSITSTGGVLSAAGGGGGGATGCTVAVCQINDLVYWFESDNILGTNGQPLTVLANRTPWNPSPAAAISGQSGATIASTTLNSLPVVQFGGTAAGRYGNLSSMTGIGNGGITVFAVIAPTLPGGGAIVSGGTNAFQLGVNSPAGTLNIQAANAVSLGNSTGALSNGVFSQVNVTYNPTSGAFSFRIARSADATGTSAHSVSAVNNAIGYRSAVNDSDLNGKIAAIIIYARVLNSTEIGNVETYLHTKWGV